MNGFYGDHACNYQHDEYRSSALTPEDETFCGVAGLNNVVLVILVQPFKNIRRVKATELFASCMGFERSKCTKNWYNYGKRGRGKKIQMDWSSPSNPWSNLGTGNMTTPRRMDDLPADGKNGAHFGHDVAVVDGQPEILVADYIYDAGIE